MTTILDVKGAAANANVVLDAIMELGATLDDQEVPDRGRWVIVHPSMTRFIARMRGAPIGRHRRARGVRGRKRALHASWRPVWHASDGLMGCQVEVRGVLAP